MGLFDGIKVVADIVSGGLSAFKASEVLDKLVERSRSEFGDKLGKVENDLYQKYVLAKGESEEGSSEALEKVENAEIDYLKALTKSSVIPQAFKDEVTAAVDAFIKADNEALEKIGKRFEKMAGTEEEKADIRKTLEESKRK